MPSKSSTGKKPSTSTHTPPDFIVLDPTDWYLAPWRNLPPLPRAAPRPFDLKAATAQLISLGERYPDWSRIDLPITLSREEANFWFLAMTAPRQSDDSWSATKVAKDISAKKVEGKLSPKAIRERLRQRHPFSERVLIPLVNLIGPARALREFPTARRGVFKWLAINDTVEINLAETFSQCVLPYLTPDEREEVRDSIRLLVSRKKWYVYEYQHNQEPAPRLESYLAAQLGMVEESEEVISSLPDGYLKWYWKHPDRIEHTSLLVFGLPDPAEQMRQMRRLDAPIDCPYLLRAWLANTELAGLDYVRDSILRAKNRDAAQGLVETLGLVRTPEIVEKMLSLQESPRAAPAVAKWFKAHRDLAVRGLKPIAAGKGEHASTAADALSKLGG